MFPQPWRVRKPPLHAFCIAVYGQLTNEEILGPLPEPPFFPEEIALVRDRVRKIIGSRLPREPPEWHQAVERRLTEDEGRLQRQFARPTRFRRRHRSLTAPFEQRRLRILNALVLAVARCGGKAWIGGREAREISITSGPATLRHQRRTRPRGAGVLAGRG